MSNLQHLLSHISTIVKKNEEFIEATGGRFNMFRILGVNHYENTHSAILAEFLNNKGSHGLKNQFLDAFLKVVADDVPDFNIDTANSYTKTEFATPEGRLDILIEDKKKRAVIIENKIYAGDQDEQLIRYNKYALKEYGEGKYVIFYLTLNGSEASTQSGSGVSYVPISYENHILKWLESCVIISARYPLVRETLNQYINSIKQLTNQGMDTITNNEIIDIVTQSSANLKSAFALISNGEKIKQVLTDKLINDLQVIANEMNLIFKFDNQLSNVYKGYYFEIENWKLCRIGFQFQANKYRDMVYGICYKSDDYLGKISSTVCKELAQRFDGKDSEYWPAYKSMKENANFNDAVFLDIIEGKYQANIRERLAEIINLADGVEL